MSGVGSVTIWVLRPVIKSRLRFPTLTTPSVSVTKGSPTHDKVVSTVFPSHVVTDPTLPVSTDRTEHIPLGGPSLQVTTVWEALPSHIIDERGPRLVWGRYQDQGLTTSRHRCTRSSPPLVVINEETLFVSIHLRSVEEIDPWTLLMSSVVTTSDTGPTTTPYDPRKTNGKGESKVDQDWPLILPSPFTNEVKRYDGRTHT